WFSEMPGATPELVEALIEEGFLSYEDVAFLEPRELSEMGGVNEEDAEEMILFAEEEAERLEKEAKAAKAGGGERAARPARAARAEPPRPEARRAFETLFIPGAAPIPPAEAAPAETHEAPSEEVSEHTEVPAEHTEPPAEHAPVEEAAVPAEP